MYHQYLRLVRVQFEEVLLHPFCPFFRELLPEAYTELDETPQKCSTWVQKLTQPFWLDRVFHKFLVNPMLHPIMVKS